MLSLCTQEFDRKQISHRHLESFVLLDDTRLITSSIEALVSWKLTLTPKRDLYLDTSRLTITVLWPANQILRPQRYRMFLPSRLIRLHSTISNYILGLKFL